MDYSSKLLENAINEISQLPGIGKRSAMRMALHLLKQPKENVDNLAEALIDLSTKIKYCKECHNISDSDICSICSNPNRIENQICVVEDIRDVMAIENTQQFRGKYHVLNGIISPVDGIGPKDLTIDLLIERISKNPIKEVIFALSATMEGDTTIYFINKKLNSFDVKVTLIARGIPLGDELQYADEITLGKSILSRIPYDEEI